MHTAAVPASTRLRSVASSSTLPRGRRVEPNATSVLRGQLQLGGGAGEELDVLGVGAGPAALDEAARRGGRAARRCAACPRRSRATPSTWRPSRRVVSKTSTSSRCLTHGLVLRCSVVDPVPRTEEAARRAASTCTGQGHVHYGMMMIARRAQAFGEITGERVPDVGRRGQRRDVTRTTDVPYALSVTPTGSCPLWRYRCA